MKSAHINAFTQNIADIHVVDTPIPQPGPGQVRVRMLLSPVNPSDLNFLHGTYHQALQRIVWNQQQAEGSKVFYDPAQATACPEPPYSLGGELTAQVVRCLGLDGHLVLYGTLANSPLQLPIRDLMMPVAHISGFLLPNWMMQQSALKLLGVLRRVKKLTIKGVFATEITTRYPLDQVTEAVTAALQPGRTGKVMLRIGEP